MQDNHFLVLGARECFEAIAQVQFFGGKQFHIESTDFPERGGFAKNKASRGPASGAAGEVPQRDGDVADEIPALEVNGAAAREAAAGFNLGGDVVEELGAGVGVGVDEDEPIAGGGFGAAIARASDLVDGLEDDGGAGVARDFGGAVGGVVVANDEFGWPVASREGSHGGIDLAQRFAQQSFFIVGGDYNRDAHGDSVTGEGRMKKAE